MKIEANDQIERFKEFMESVYHDELHRLSTRGINIIKLDFNELMQFDHELADDLLEFPEDTIRAAEISIEGLDLNIKNFRVRVVNLPKDQLILIREIRSIHLNKFMSIEGIVRQSSDVRPQVTSAKFECPACGTTMTLLQLDTKFREPTRCSCGRRGRFRLIGKDLVDAQRLVLEEVPESLESGEQPKRLSIFLKEDLVEPKMEKHTTPGSKVLVNGIVKEVPIMLKSGAQSIRYDLMMETNYIDPIEKSYWEVEISEKDEEEIRTLSQNPRIYDDLVKSIAASVYGHEKVKEALVLQLMGGVRKVKEDGTVIRGDMHILLVGDPGCISGDSQVALYYKGMEKIQNLGNKHLQPIKEYVSKIRKNGRDKHYDIATKFHIYKNQPVLKIVTESGKEVICTYNQPFLTKEDWKRADELLIGTEIRVMPKIPNNIKKFHPTNFSRVKKNPILKKVVLLDKITPELASLYGYIVGDGHVHKNGYRIYCYVNNEETDLIEKLSGLWKNTFDITPRIFTVDKVSLKTINEGGYLRKFTSKQKMHILEVNSKQIASSLSFLSKKRVPQEIFKSPNKVIAEFISWLFEADGCAFGKGRGRTAIQLKSVNKKLLQDVQLLLLYFGIHSRIIENNLCIRRSYDIELYIKHIGFKSTKKQKNLSEVLNSIKNKSEIQKRKLLQRYEKIIDIVPNGVQDVYDFEVPIGHTFIANGIVCHNSAKSTMLTSITKIAPKSRFVAGKSVSGVGLCIAPDSLILTNPGGIFEIKDLVEDNLKNNEKLYHNGVWNAINPESKKKIFTLDENFKIKPKEINQFWRIAPPEYMIKLKTRMGKEIIVTPNTKIYDSNLSWKEAINFKKDDYIATVRNLKFEENKNSIFTLDLIKSNPVIRGIKDKVKFLIEEACKKKSIDKRTLARNLNINELNIYHNWVNKKARGNIKLKSLKLLSNYAEIPLEEIIDDNARFSLYGNHSIKLPMYLNEDSFYLAGLLAGDGDLSKGKNSITIRFSNNSKELMNKFISISKNLFDVKANLSSKRSNKRAESWRFSSKLVYEILESLGIPISPKSHKIDMSNILLKIPNDLLSSYLRGYYDTDGGCVQNIKGSNYIESNSTSKIFSEKLKLVLLRYGIISKIREKKAMPNLKIKSKYNKFAISIQGKENLEKYKNFIGFNHPEKYEKLNGIINRISKVNTNIDIIPNAKFLIREAEKDLKTKLTHRRGKSHISRNYLSNLVNNIKYIKNENINTLNKLANSDIFWDKVNEIEIIKNHNYDYVYDLTVENSHNFIVNGILVHNTASVVKDEFLRGWALEAGAMVLANGGQLLIDELDKMSSEDRDALHEALEQQRVSIAKANIQATLRCQTTVLAAANPRLGRFDPYTPIASQIELPSTLINRFDLIFPIRDLPSTEIDTKIASHVLRSQQNPEEIKPIIPIPLFKKYISYAKQKVFPKLTNEAVEEIKNFYVALRNSGQKGEGELRPIPISARQLEALVRLAEGSARTRLSDKVTREDAIRSINLLKHCLMQVGFDYETGQIDIDRITTGVTTSQRSRIITVREIVKKLESKFGKIIALQDIIEEATIRNIDQAHVEETLEQLKREGYLFEPKKGQISLL